MRRRRVAGDEGGVELFVLIVTVVLVAALGLVVDLGGRMRASDNAAWTAQQAARAAAEQVSGAHAQAGVLPVVASSSGVAAAEQVIATAGMTGTVAVVGDTVTVTVSTTYDPMILDAGSAWTVTETATARIARGIGTEER